MGRGGRDAILSSKTIVNSVIVYLEKLGLIKGLVRPLKVRSTNNIVKKYKVKKHANVVRLPDINPSSMKELLAIEETTIK